MLYLVYRPMQRYYIGEFSAERPGLLALNSFTGSDYLILLAYSQRGLWGPQIARISNCCCCLVGFTLQTSQPGVS
jgi:hypothetical protein